MMPVLAAPWFLLGLAALPMLAGIYWLRNRFRRKTVSTLMLWADQREAREGGRRLARIQTPLLFFLELATLMLLAWAAAGPMVLSRQGTRPLVVVLDDSFSMLARPEGETGKPAAGKSGRDRALEALLEEIRSDKAYSVRFVLAQAMPQVLGKGVQSSGEVEELLEQWRCRSASAEVEKAVALACEIGGATARVLVLTDHAAPEDYQRDSRVAWWAFGIPGENIGFVNAVRLRSETAGSGSVADRCLIEATHFGESDARRTLTIRAREGGAVLKREEIVMRPGETRRLLFVLPPGTRGIEAEMSGDMLALDDHVYLLEQPERKVSVRVQTSDAELGQDLRRAIEATRRADFQGRSVELLFTDSATAGAGSETWVVRFIADSEAVSYSGPYIVDGSHPLTKGFSLDGVIWGGGRKGTLSGRPLVAVDDVPLLTDSERADGTHDVLVSLTSKLSTFQESVDWPVFIWNVIDWRAGHLSGLAGNNLRLGDSATLVLPRGIEKVVVHQPTGEAREISAPGGRLTLPATDVGVFRIEPVSSTRENADAAGWSFAASALSADESDLRGCVSGRWGDWARAVSLGWDYVNIAWMLLLGTLAILAAHQLILARSRRQGAFETDRRTQP